MFKRDPVLTLRDSSHGPHSLIISLIKRNATVLDVGCNAGYLGKKLVEEKGVVPDGIDINDEALLAAKPYYRNVFKRDLYKGELNLPCDGDTGMYDYILFADVLEHLPRPDLVLRDSRRYLNRDGSVIASIPNVARLEIRLKLLFGHFDYTEGGITNQDHLRFFTRSSSMKMLQSCGYTVQEVLPTGLGHIVRVFPTLTSFQFIYVCCAAKADAP
jgi:2-polyprenyl-3-methyl-5-hydroxy-6-metoxy-1,4-benzoquinol methylase